ncbi:ATP-dependent DNA ligase [Gongronella butleri]|nr:ATP-dependent DNA ligase [Gongronella butleri]
MADDKVNADAAKAEADQKFDEEIEQAKREEEEQAQEDAFEKEEVKAFVPYALLCQMFEKCEATTKRLEITEYVVQLFIQLCPDYEGLELGIGESLLMKAIANSTGRTMALIKSDYVQTGDLGTVAKESKGSQRTLFKPKPLTCPQVFKTLKEIAQLTGQSSQNKKVSKIQGLLVACQESEAKYLIRQLEGKLRIGLAAQTVLSALAQAAIMSKPEFKKWSKDKKEEQLIKAAETLKSVYNQLPSYDMIVPNLLKYPLDELASKCTMRPGIPLKPMLAHPTKSLPEILDRFQDQSFTCEFKYDGERAQIHRLEDGTIAVYSRNSENMSVRYPEIASKINNWVGDNTQTFILDCEAVAWDRVKGCILPFQILSTRKRKDVKEEEITVQVAMFAFDCLYLNGKSLLQEPLSKRRQLLRESFKETPNEFYFAQHMDSKNIDDIQTFLDVSIHSNCEGLMVKSYEGPSSTYEPSKRSRNWLKVKKDYLGGAGDTVDLVILGADFGKGKRTSVYGAFLLACYDESSEMYQTICKIGTGFSEELLQTIYDKLKDHVISEPRSFYCHGEGSNAVDVWFDPAVMLEVQFADLSISPRYMAGVGIIDPAKGISLRFPRCLRIREDKGMEDATSSEQVKTLIERNRSQFSFFVFLFFFFLFAQIVSFYEAQGNHSNPI